MNRRHRIHRHALWLTGYLLLVAAIALVMGLNIPCGVALLGAAVTSLVAGATWQRPFKPQTFSLEPIEILYAGQPLPKRKP